MMSDLKDHKVWGWQIYGLVSLPRFLGLWWVLRTGHIVCLESPYNLSRYRQHQEIELEIQCSRPISFTPTAKTKLGSCGLSSYMPSM